MEAASGPQARVIRALTGPPITSKVWLTRLVGGVMLVVCVLQRLRFVGALAAAGILAVASTASAAVLPIFTTESDTITAGEKGVLHLHLELKADPGNYDAQFAGGLLTFNSGNGAHTSFDLGFGGTSRDFSYAFNYAAPGRYTPTFMLTGSFTQKYDGSVYYNVPKTTRIKTGSCSSCWTYKTVMLQKSELKTFSDSEEFTLKDSLSLAATEPVVTPLPAALPLYATGLGLVALLAWRKRRRAASAT